MVLSSSYTYLKLFLAGLDLKRLLSLVYMGFLNPHGRGHPVPRASPCKSPLASPGHPPGGCLGKKVSLRTTSLWDVVKNACALERIPSTLWKNLATAFNSNSTTPYTTHEWAPYFFQGGGCTFVENPHF
jgi:hypothetical protein